MLHDRLCWSSGSQHVLQADRAASTCCQVHHSSDSIMPHACFPCAAAPSQHCSSAVVNLRRLVDPSHSISSSTATTAADQSLICHLGTVHSRYIVCHKHTPQQTSRPLCKLTLNCACDTCTTLCDLLPAGCSFQYAMFLNSSRSGPVTGLGGRPSLRLTGQAASGTPPHSPVELLLHI